MKVCSDCKVEKELTEFWGKETCCKSCSQERDDKRKGGLGDMITKLRRKYKAERIKSLSVEEAKNFKLETGHADILNRMSGSQEVKEFRLNWIKNLSMKPSKINIGTVDGSDNFILDNMKIFDDDTTIYLRDLKDIIEEDELVTNNEDEKKEVTLLDAMEEEDGVTIEYKEGSPLESVEVENTYLLSDNRILYVLSDIRNMPSALNRGSNNFPYVVFIDDTIGGVGRVLRHMGADCSSIFNGENIEIVSEWQEFNTQTECFLHMSTGGKLTDGQTVLSLNSRKELVDENGNTVKQGFYTPKIWSSVQ